MSENSLQKKKDISGSERSCFLNKLPKLHPKYERKREMLRDRAEKITSHIVGSWKAEAQEQMEWESEKENLNSNWFRHKQALNHVLFTMRLNSLTPRQTQPLNQTQRVSLPVAPQAGSKIQDFTLTNLVSDKTSLLSDEILLKILSKLPKSQRTANFLVSKRWLNLQGRLVKSIKLLDWEFLVTGRLSFRFPNLIHVDLVNGCMVSSRNSGIFSTHKSMSFHVGCDGKDWYFDDNSVVLNANEVDRGLRVLASGCPNLQKLEVVNSSEMGLLGVAEDCPMLQELDLLICNDRVLRGIAACQNLQILSLTGSVDGLYDSLVSDVGLTILAQGCKILVKLELGGCRGSYEGIKAIGQCCQMLQELTLRNHKMENGWLFALSYCKNLTTLKFVSCKKIDGTVELDPEYLESCPSVQRLHLEKCQLRDKRSLKALFLVCHDVRKLVLHNCWGLNDDMFSTSSALRKVRILCLEGCSMLTTGGLESVIIYWNELESLKVHSCNNINPAVSNVFSALKDLKWKPDTKSLLLSTLDGTGMGKKGRKFFNKSSDWRKSLPRPRA